MQIVAEWNKLFFKKKKHSSKHHQHYRILDQCYKICLARQVKLVTCRPRTWPVKKPVFFFFLPKQHHFMIFFKKINAWVDQVNTRPVTRALG
jgi:hypothetical protein